MLTPKISVLSMALGLSVLLWASANATAQSAATVYPLRTAPSPAYQEPIPTDYNIRWNDFYLRLAADLGLAFDDNVRYSEDNRESDVVIEPGVTLGILWAPAPEHQFNVDVRVGYRSYLDNDNLNSLDIAPDSSVDYTIGINRTTIRLFNQMSTQVDASQNVQIAEDPDAPTPGRGLEFRRFSNEVGAEVTYQPTVDFRTRGRYGFGINRSISGDDFQQLDRDEHGFEVSAGYTVAADLSAGAFGRATLLRYKDKGSPDSRLDDSEQYSVGPYLSYTPADNLSFNGSFSYTESKVDNDGMGIEDTEDFSGLTFQVGAQHQISSQVSHSVNVGRTVDPGVRRNFADRWTVNYGISGTPARNLTLRGSLGYDRLASTDFGGDPEEADLYNASVGATFLVIRNLTANLTYSYTLRDSNLDSRGYYRNRVSLLMQYDF